MDTETNLLERKYQYHQASVTVNRFQSAYVHVLQSLLTPYILEYIHVTQLAPFFFVFPINPTQATHKSS